MKHDLAHEVAQDEAIKMLCGAVASLAGKMGATDVMHVVAHVNKLMADDEAEPEAPAPVEAPKAELHVAWPAADLVRPADPVTNEADWSDLEVK